VLNQYIDILRQEFGEEILNKTAYGRNEIKLVLEKAMSNAALKYLAAAGNVNSLTPPKEDNPNVPNPNQ
jgi:hypothetical protein